MTALGKAIALEDTLAATEPYQEPRRKRPAHPKGFEPGVKYAAGLPAEVTVQVEAIGQDEQKWREDITRVTGLTIPDGRKVELSQVRYWGDPGAPMVYCRFTISDRMLGSSLDLGELVKAAKRRPRKIKAPTGDRAYVIALGDLQLGKVDGDGVDGTVERFYASTERAIQRLKVLRKRDTIGPIYLTHLGDCIEGFVSQGGANAWRTVLTLTEQVRLYRRLLLEQVKALAPLTEQLVVAGIPGNHDEANRPLHTYGDSWAIDAASQVADALELAGTYEHVSVVTPARDELTLTLDVAGTIVGLAHGHQWRAGQAVNWWGKMSHGRQPIGDADLLLSAHLHHLRVEDTGPKTWMQVPALESESTWWRHKTGEASRPGIVTMTVGGGGWSEMEVL